MRLLNRLLRPLGVMLVPLPPSAKMLHEHANVSEVHHPSRGGDTVRWMRRVGYLTAERRYDRETGKLGDTIGQLSAALADAQAENARLREIIQSHDGPGHDTELANLEAEIARLRAALRAMARRVGEERRINRLMYEGLQAVSSADPYEPHLNVTTEQIVEAVRKYHSRALAAAPAPTYTTRIESTERGMPCGRRECASEPPHAPHTAAPAPTEGEA